jgi:YHS domain-containing protein
VPAADFLLEHMSRTLFDPVDPTQVGSLDSTLHARVNGEIYRFASHLTLRRFRRDPARWCGLVRDPVSGRIFVPTPESRRFAYRDGPYFFASDSSYRVFRADPEKYAIHRDY